MKPRTQPCIALGWSGNEQGSIVCFQVRNVKLVRRRTVEPLPMPNQIIRAMNLWGKLSAKAKRKASTKQLEFLNRNKEKFNWNNEELDLSKAKVLPDMATPHYDVLAEMPGVRLESDFVSDTPVGEWCLATVILAKK